jgi:glycerate 2-kinase
VRIPAWLPGRMAGVDIQTRKATLRNLFGAALTAVDPETLTRDALAGSIHPETTLIALGKAAAGMCRGAAVHIDSPRGVVVAIAEDEVPPGIELLVGEHPVPGEKSFTAGRRVLEVVRHASGPIIALISGGGSAVCEHPIDGVEAEFIREANQVRISSGAPIEDINLVRRHLSAIKGGGLVYAAGRPIDTYAISDVGDADPSVIASGPTAHVPANPDAAASVMKRHGIDIPQPIQHAMTHAAHKSGAASTLTVIADGHTASNALAASAANSGLEASVLQGWLKGPIDEALDDFISRSGPGLTIATGEPEVLVTGDGRGGRNTHAALLASTAIAETDWVFAALATDGVDGNSSSAGAIVDGATSRRAGDPGRALALFDSAGYLDTAGDLIRTGPTGTNVSDIWVLWR